MGSGDENKLRKEDHILCAFINGLKDKRIAKAVELMKPADTASALLVAKKEENKQGKNTDGTCFLLTKEEDKPSETLLKEMNLQIKLLTEQVTYLTNLIKKRL